MGDVIMINRVYPTTNPPLFNAHDIGLSWENEIEPDFSKIDYYETYLIWWDHNGEIHSHLFKIGEIVSTTTCH